MQKKRSWMTSLVMVALITFLCLPPIAALGGYPEKPITVLVAFDPGSPADLISRAAGVEAEKQLGQPLIFENKGGGGGSVALSIAANAKPDGYTICAAPNVSVVDTALMQKVTYKPLGSFTPIVGLAVAEHTALVVQNDAPWKTAKEFIDHSKKNPGKVKYSSTGVGAGMHVVMAYVAQVESIDWVFMPYKAGPQARAALLGGHVDACSTSIDWPPFVKSGQLRVLATHGTVRSPHFPEIPTMIELGYDVTNYTVHSIFAPAGLPSDIKTKLEAAFLKSIESDEFKTAREKLYLSPTYMNSKDLGSFLKKYWDKEEKMFKTVGIIKEPATQPD